MRLLPIVKELRLRFSDIKIKQLKTEYNQTYILFDMGDDKNPLELYPEYNHIVMDFGGHKSGYGLSDDDFEYMVKEIQRLISSEICAFSIYINDELVGSILVDVEKINDDFIKTEINKLYFYKYKNNSFDGGYVKLTFVDSEKDCYYYFGRDCAYIEKN